MNYTYFVNDEQVTLINLESGNRVTMFEDDPRFHQFRTFIQEGHYENAEGLDVKHVLESYTLKNVGSNFAVKISDGMGSIILNDSEYPLADAITNRILKMNTDGFDVFPLVNFLENLYKNPSKTAIDELFLFLDACELPITSDGCFIAYKIVRNDYLDIYSGKMSNAVGNTVEMPRFEVDDRRENTCSKGLHFCSKEYLTAYGSSNRDTDRCVLVKINPADVVSIPSDYNNAKGRTAKYVVVGEVQDAEWRDILAQRDYTSSSVVDEDGDDFEYDLDEDYDSQDMFDIIEDMGYSYSYGCRRWVDIESNTFVSADTVSSVTGYSIQELKDAIQ
jgi:hypothetical protein